MTTPIVPDAQQLRQVAQVAQVAQVVEGWLASLASANTRSAYRLDLTTYLRWCVANGASPLAPDTALVERFRTDPALPLGAAAVARRRAALNAFLRHLQQFEHTGDSGDTATGVGASPLASPRVSEAPVVTSPTVGLEPGERGALLRSMGRHSSTTQVLVALLLLEGLKLDEALRLDAGHVSAANGERPIRIRLDRAPPRDHDVGPTTAGVLAAHLDGRRRGPLLVTSSRREQAGARLSRHGADYLLRQAGARIGLPAPLTSNVLRRTHAAHAHASGQTIDTIARRMGHDDVRTTRRYLDLPSTSTEPSPNPPTDPSHPSPSPHQTAAGGAGSRRRPISQEV